MIPAEHLALLQELATDEQPHSRRTLLDHLSGTRRLLEDWGNEPDVCTAGLFHSIYGTSAFRHESATFDQRDQVRSVIGDRAEDLAFLFCVSDRSGFFDQVAAERPVLRRWQDGMAVPVTRETVDQLVEIEVANVVEQVEPAGLDRRQLDGMQRMLDKGRGHMSHPATRALAELVARCRTQLD